MTELPITSLFTAAFIVGLVALSINVSLRRIEARVSIGNGADAILDRRIRAQGNFIEYVPIALVALGLVEASAAPSWMVLSIGATLAAGRILHATGMLGGSIALRVVGMILTYLTLLATAIRLVVNVLR